jgi:hypothetical protein
MVDGTERNDEAVRTDKEEIFSKSVRAGKRTYFFDVKTTRRNDYYLTLTESKKKFNRDGRFYFEKHKIFLYKEDFEKFSDGLAEVIAYIKANAPEILDPIEPVVPADVKAESAPAEISENESAEAVIEDAVNEEVGEAITESFSNVEFEDLEDNKEG